jgi:gamma-glutamyltranspeptidase/glutathione hydrolase
MAVLDWNMDAQAAVSRPHVVSRNGSVDLEKGTPAERLRDPLEARGDKVNMRELTSGLHLILVENGKLVGGADPRREGMAAGR